LGNDAQEPFCFFRLDFGHEISDIAAGIEALRLRW